jgi:CelD/BcsL family acetyltransferase involved in cellulose biosynthesis
MGSAIRQSIRRDTLRVEWMTDAASLARVEGPWRRLEAAVPHRTHVSTFDFLDSWYRCYAGEYGGSPLVGLAWQDADLVGVAPLTIRRGRLGRVPVRRIDFAPTDSIAGEFLVSEHRRDIVPSFLRSLRATARFDVICLNGFEHGSPLLLALQETAGDCRLPVETEDHAYAMVDLAPGYQAYWMRLNGDVRRKLSHRARKITALGASVDGALPVDNTDDVEARIARMIAITEASHKLHGQRLAWCHRRFLAEVIRRFARQGMLSLPILRIGGRDAAFILGVVERGCFYDITLSYDESFARLGPGMFLMQETLKQFSDAGIHTVISHGAHEYKRTWSTRFVPQRRLFLFRRRPRAAAARLMRFGLQPVWRRLGGYPELGGGATAPMR